ncbi:MAG: FtsX-like permease family protein [Myxococcota bacterium]
MIAVRWRKAYRDLWLARSRTLLAALSLGVGAFAVGAVLVAYAVLTREIDAGFRGTRPPSAIAHFEQGGADSTLARDVERLPGVLAAEPRGLFEGRVRVGADEWRRILFFVVEDFAALRVSSFRHQSGSSLPGVGEMLIERSAVPFLAKSSGHELEVQTPLGPRRSLRIVGVVHDAAQSPGWVDGIAYAYVTAATMESLGESRPFNELRLLTRPGVSPRATESKLRELVAERRGVVSVVNTQGARHPHADQMQALLFLFAAFAALASLPAALLTASVISTLLAKETRQIGAMKTLGATSRQIAQVYGGAVGLLALLASIVALPLASLAGLAYADFVAGVLNFDLGSRKIPGWVFAIELVLSLLLPLLAAGVPVLRASRVSIRQAINITGSLTATPSTARKRGAEFPWLPRWTVLALRNLWRQRLRFGLTLGMMSLGGATFMSALNVSEAWRATVEALFQARHYDLEVIFAKPETRQRIAETLGRVPGVRSFEAWSNAHASAHRSGDEQEFGLTITGVPPNSRMLQHELLEGRWLRSNDEDAVVINHELREAPEARLALGTTLEVRSAGGVTHFRVVGVVREIGARRRGQNIPAAAYANQRALERASGSSGVYNRVVLRAEDARPEALAELNRRLERTLDAAQLERRLVQTSTQRKRELLDHLVVIRNFLLAMAALVASVGGLALASAMSLNVMERTRELGVMRALGASTRLVVWVFVTEGLAIGALSAVLAFLVSLPLSVAIGDFAGRVFVHTNLDRAVSAVGVGAWFGLAFLIALGASSVPALSAARGSVGRALRYE